MTDEEIEQLDPGIRDTVLLMHAYGFEPTDSGDGVSKPADWYLSGEALSFPHVVAVTHPGALVSEANRLGDVLGRGWFVEATYSTQDGTAVLLARKVLEEPKGG